MAIELTCIKVSKEYKQLKRKGYVEELKVIYGKRIKETGEDYRLNRRLYTIPATLPALGDKIYLTPHIYTIDLTLAPITIGIDASGKLVINTEFKNIGDKDCPSGFYLTYEVRNTDTNSVVHSGIAGPHSPIPAGGSYPWKHTNGVLLAGNYHVKLEINAGNVIEESDTTNNIAEKTFTIEDVTAPIISNVHTEVTTTSGTVYWTTNEPTKFNLVWGTTTEYLQGIANSEALSTNWDILMTGLTPDTRYYFKITVTDAAGNVSTLEQFFKTLLIYFEDNFEEGLTTKWSAETGPGSIISIGYNVGGNTTKLLRMACDPVNNAYVHARPNIDTTIKEGMIIEFDAMIDIPNVSEYHLLWMENPGNGSMLFVMGSKLMHFVGPSSIYALADWVKDHWYHVKIQFHHAEGTYNVWLDGVLVGDHIAYRYSEWAGAPNLCLSQLTFRVINWEGNAAGIMGMCIDNYVIMKQ